MNTVSFDESDVRGPLHPGLSFVTGRKRVVLCKLEGC